MPTKDPEARKKILKRYRQRNREKLSASHRRWRLNQPAMATAAAQRHGEARREQKRAYMRLYNHLSIVERAVWSATKRERKNRHDDVARIGPALGRWPTSFVRFLSPDEKRVWSNLYFLRLKARDPQTLLSARLRSRLYNVLKKAGVQKCATTFDLVGCTAIELVAHFTKQFLPGMGWDNRHLWCVDHVRPLRAFDLRVPEQQRAAMHYSNLQPLWRVDNRRKWDRLPDGSLARRQ